MSLRASVSLAKQSPKTILSLTSYYVYMKTNSHNRIIYTGVTNDLVRRMHEHRVRLVPSLTKRYNIEKLVYGKAFSDPQMRLQGRRRSGAALETER